MQMPSFKIPTIRQVWYLVQQGDYVFSIDLMDDYLYIPTVKHHNHSCGFFWQHKPFQWKIFPLELATTHRV